MAGSGCFEGNVCVSYRDILTFYGVSKSTFCVILETEFY